MSKQLRSVLLFPVQLGGWTLVQVNMQEKTVFVIDPARTCTSVNAVLVHLFCYLKTELLFHRSEEIERSPWSELRFKMTQIAPSLHPGLCICQHAYETCTGKTATPLPDFRLRMLKSISNLSASLWIEG